MNTEDEVTLAILMAWLGSLLGMFVMQLSPLTWEMNVISMTVAYVFMILTTIIFYYE